MSPYLRNLLAQTGARALLVVSTLGTFVAVARLRGPEAFGQYSYVVTFATLFSTLADFGTGAILGKELAERRGASDRAFWGTFLGLRLALALGLVPLALVAAWALKAELFAPLALAALAIPVLSFRFFEPVYQVYDRPWQALPPAALSSVVYVGSTLLVLHAGGGVLPLLVGYVLANATYAALAAALAARSLRARPAFRPELVRAILTLALPLGVSTVFTNLNSRVGIFLLGALRTDYDVGIYNAAYRFLDFAAMGAVLLVMPLIPIFARKALSDRPGLGRDYIVLVRHLLVALVPVVLLLPAVTPTIVRLCFGDAFAEAAPVLDVLGTSAALVFFSLASSAVNVSLGVVRHGYWNGAVAASLNLALASALVPVHGALGAAWSALAAEVVMLAISQFYTTRALGAALWRGLPWLRVGALALGLAAWRAWSPLGAAASGALGVAVYGALAWSLGLIDLRALRRGGPAVPYPAPEVR